MYKWPVSTPLLLDGAKMSLKPVYVALEGIEPLDTYTNLKPIPIWINIEILIFSPI